MKACLLAALLSAAIFGQNLPKASADYGAFALPDQTGHRLIAIPEMPGAESVKRALCSDGRSLRVRFGHRQIERTGSDGRQTPSRFDDLPGDVFRIVGSTAPSTASCLLAGNGWISGAVVVPILAVEKHSGCGTEMEMRLTTSRHRSVVRCFPLGRIGKDGRVDLAEFARVGKDALASVVLSKGARLLFGDYPAEFRAEGEDLWRVDDGGKLSADGFELMFVAQRGNEYALAVNWAGTEGRALALFVSTTGNGFSRVLEDYWYQMPI